MGKPQHDQKKKNTKIISCAIGEKNSSRISRRVSNRRKSCIKMENFACINDALSFHSYFGLQRSWKLVPKDSCEVYKDRKRRDNKKTREEESGRKNSKKEQGRRGAARRKPSSEGDVTDEESRHSREKPVRATKKTKKTKAKSGRKKKSLRRPSSDGSASSNSEATTSPMSSSDTDLSH